MKNDQERLQLEDTPMDMLQKMCGGNPGALTVLLEIIKNGESIDPDISSSILYLLYLDTYKIYDEKIWMLYKDVCGENITKTMALLRAVQFGYLSEKDLHHAINNYGEGVDPEIYLKRVKVALSNFNV